MTSANTGGESAHWNRLLLSPAYRFVQGETNVFCSISGFREISRAHFRHGAQY